MFVSTAGTPAVLLTKSGDLQVKHMFFPNTPVLFLHVKLICFEKQNLVTDIYYALPLALLMKKMIGAGH